MKVQLGNSFVRQTEEILYVTENQDRYTAKFSAPGLSVWACAPRKAQNTQQTTEEDGPSHNWSLRGKESSSLRPEQWGGGSGWGIVGSCRSWALFLSWDKSKRSH